MTTSLTRQAYPSDVTDEEWAFLEPYLRLMREDAPQRQYPLRELFNALRWIVRAGAPWRYLPKDFPPWYTVFQQTRRWLAAGVFATLVRDLRAFLRIALDREPDPTAAILDSRTLQSTPESGHRGGYDGAKRKKGSKVHAAVDSLGNLLTLQVTAANEQDRKQVAKLAKDLQQTTHKSVKVAFVDQGYTGEQAARDAAKRGIELTVVKLPGARHGFMLVPRRWVGERSFAWAARFRRLVKDYERLPSTLLGMHLVAFTGLMLSSLLAALTGVSA